MKKHLKDLLFGIYAGLAIALGGFLFVVSKTLLTSVNADLATLVGALLFPVGLTLVCFLGLNLFTGKIGYLLDNKKDYIAFLGIVYLGNLIGSLIAGFLLVLIFKNVDPVYSTITAIGLKKANSVTSVHSAIAMFGGACACGALVYIAVFCYKTFKNVALKVIGIFIPIALFVYLGFDHCVANMFYFTFSLSFPNPFSYLNILLATIGNSVGAIIINFIVKIIKKPTAN